MSNYSKTGTQHNKNKKRKYIRKCGHCGERYEQSDMIRTDESPNGWLCENCYECTQDVDYDDGYSSNGL